MADDHRRQGHQHVGQDIGCHNVVLFIAHPVLYLFLRDDIADDQFKLLRGNAVVSPADGIVQMIADVEGPEELGMDKQKYTRISIFMSVFSVHVNRVPVSGIVHKLNYRPGKFVSVQDKDSEDNERQEISVIMKNGTKIGFIQIAGLVARRIYCPLKLGDKLTAGQIFGLIRFGSRLDVFLPKGVEPKVIVGQTTIAGETVLADLSEK